MTEGTKKLRDLLKSCGLYTCNNEDCIVCLPKLEKLEKELAKL